MGGLTTAIAWLAINAVMWATLLGLPLLAGVPLVWRLFVGVFANFYLFPFARRLGERSQERLQGRSASVDNPFQN